MRFSNTFLPRRALHWKGGGDGARLAAASEGAGSRGLDLFPVASRDCFLLVGVLASAPGCTSQPAFGFLAGTGLVKESIDSVVHRRGHAKREERLRHRGRSDSSLRFFQGGAPREGNPMEHLFET